MANFLDEKPNARSNHPSDCDVGKESSTKCSTYWGNERKDGADCEGPCT